MKDYRALVQEVALYLGQPWKYNFLKYQSEREWRAEIIDGTGKGLFFYYDEKGRFEISGQFPRDRTRYASCGKIGVSTHRTAKSIAQDIERRLLPDYHEAYEKGQKLYLAEQEKEQQRLFKIQSVATALRGTPGKDHYYSQDCVNFEGGSAVFNYRGSIELKMHNLTIAEAVQVASELLRIRSQKE